MSSLELHHIVCAFGTSGLQTLATARMLPDGLRLGIERYCMPSGDACLLAGDGVAYGYLPLPPEYFCMVRIAPSPRGVHGRGTSLFGHGLVGRLSELANVLDGDPWLLARNAETCFLQTDEALLNGTATLQPLRLRTADLPRKADPRAELQEMIGLGVVDPATVEAALAGLFGGGRVAIHGPLQSDGLGWIAAVHQLLPPLTRMSFGATTGMLMQGADAFRLILVPNSGLADALGRGTGAPVFLDKSKDPFPADGAARELAEMLVDEILDGTGDWVRTFWEAARDLPVLAHDSVVRKVVRATEMFWRIRRAPDAAAVLALVQDALQQVHAARSDPGLCQRLARAYLSECEGYFRAHPEPGNDPAHLDILLVTLQLGDIAGDGNRPWPIAERQVRSLWAQQRAVVAIRLMSEVTRTVADLLLDTLTLLATLLRLDSTALKASLEAGDDRAQGVVEDGFRALGELATCPEEAEALVGSLEVLVTGLMGPAPERLLSAAVESVGAQLPLLDRQSILLRLGLLAQKLLQREAALLAVRTVFDQLTPAAAEHPDETTTNLIEAGRLWASHGGNARLFETRWRGQLTAAGLAEHELHILCEVARVETTSAVWRQGILPYIAVLLRDDRQDRLRISPEMAAWCAHMLRELPPPRQLETLPRLAIELDPEAVLGWGEDLLLAGLEPQDVVRVLLEADPGPAFARWASELLASPEATPWIDRFACAVAGHLQTAPSAQVEQFRSEDAHRLVVELGNRVDDDSMCRLVGRLSRIIGRDFAIEFLKQLFGKLGTATSAEILASVVAKIDPDSIYHFVHAAFAWDSPIATAALEAMVGLAAPPHGRPLAELGFPPEPQSQVGKWVLPRIARDRWTGFCSAVAASSADAIASAMDLLTVVGPDDHEGQTSVIDGFVAAVPDRFPALASALLDNAQLCPEQWMRPARIAAGRWLRLTLTREREKSKTMTALRKLSDWLDATDLLRSLPTVLGNYSLRRADWDELVLAAIRRLPESRKPAREFFEAVLGAGEAGFPIGWLLDRVLAQPVDTRAYQEAVAHHVAPEGSLSIDIWRRLRKLWLPPDDRPSAAAVRGFEELLGGDERWAVRWLYNPQFRSELGPADAELNGLFRQWTAGPAAAAAARTAERIEVHLDRHSVQTPGVGWPPRLLCFAQEVRKASLGFGQRAIETSGLAIAGWIMVRVATAADLDFRSVGGPPKSFEATDSGLFKAGLRRGLTDHVTDSGLSVLFSALYSAIAAPTALREAAQAIAVERLAIVRTHGTLHDIARFACSSFFQPTQSTVKLAGATGCRALREGWLDTAAELIEAARNQRMFPEGIATILEMWWREPTFMLSGGDPPEALQKQLKALASEIPYFGVPGMVSDLLRRLRR